MIPNLDLYPVIIPHMELLLKEVAILLKNQCLCINSTIKSPYDSQANSQYAKSIHHKNR